MIVGGDLAGGQGDGCFTPGLSPIIKREPRSLSLLEGGNALQVRQGKSAAPVAAVCGAEQRKKRGVLTDWEELTVAQCPTDRGKVAAKNANFTYELVGHIIFWFLAS